MFIALANLSTALILGATSILLMFISRVKISHLSLLIFFVLFSGGIALLTGQRGYTAISRVEDFINKRMILANSQREHSAEYDYYIENQDLNTAVNNIIDIICKLEEQ